MTSDVYPHPQPEFCHQCGARLRLQAVEGDHRQRLVCEGCGFIHYLNPRVVAAAIPERTLDGRREALLMRRALEPMRGFWTPPGGFVEVGESAEEAAAREAEEEVSLQIEVTGLQGVYSRPSVGIVVVMFRARVVGGEAATSEEALEVRWFRDDEVPWEELAFETTQAAMKDWAADSAQRG